jgi:hypothetical protein
MTRYQVIVGPGTAFERDWLKWSDFPNGLASTILVVESGHPVPWAKPVDVEYAPDKPLPSLRSRYTKPKHFLCYETSRRRGFNVCFADGRWRFIPSDTDEQIIRRLIDRNSPPVDMSSLD